MKNVEFENINSCGSIIRNKKPLSINKTYENVLNTNNIKVLTMFKFNNAQFEISQLYNLRSNNLQYELR